MTGYKTLPAPLTSLFPLEALAKGEARSLPSLYTGHERPASHLLRRSADLLERYGVIEKGGKEGKAYQLKKPGSPLIPCSVILENQVLERVDEYRTAHTLSQKLQLSRYDVENALENLLRQGKIERIYVGLLGDYTKKPEVAAQ